VKKVPQFLTRSATAKMLGIHRRTLYNWEHSHIGPPSVQLGKRFYYTVEIINQWINARKMAGQHSASANPPPL